MIGRAALFVLILAAPAQAEAEFVTARLDWQKRPGAAECVTGEALELAVTRRLARNPFVGHRADIVVHGTIGPRPAGGWQVELELVTRAGARIGTRSLQTDAAQCSGLDESLPLVLALMIDVPREELRRADRSLAARKRPAAPPRTTPLAVPAPSGRDSRFRAAAVASGALGLLPGAALGAGVTLGIEPPTFWLTELDLAVWLPKETGGAAGARYELVTASLHLCPLTLETAPLRVDLCAGQRVGRLEGRGFGFETNREQARLIYDLSVRARGWVELAGPIGVLFGVGGQLPLARDRFFFSDADGSKPELFRVSPVIGTAELGLGVSLP